MPISTTIDVQHSVIIRTLTGEPSIREALAEMDEDFQRPGFHAGMNTLWDLTRASVGHLTAEDVRRLAHGIGERMEGRGADFKSAIVVPEDLGYGVMRMFGAFADELPIRRKIFRSYGQAWAWLLDSAEQR